MCAQTREEEQRSRWRRRLTRGLLVGGAAVGLPAIANAWWKRQAARIEAPSWGRQEVFDWRGGEIRFRRLGQGESLLLLHSFGLGHDSCEWREVAERLAANHEVIVPDLLGWGRSDRGDHAYTAKLYVDLVEDMLEEVVQGPVVVIAAGQSAAFAIKAASSGRDRVRGLGIVTPIGIDTDRDGPGHRGKSLFRLLRVPILGTSALNVLTTRSGIAKYLKREVFAAPEKADAKIVDRHFRSAHRGGDQGALAAHLSGRLYLDVGTELASLEQPVFLAWGRQCSSPPVETADLWLRHLEGAELEIFDDCGRLPHLEAPASFCASIEPFLARIGQ